MPISTKSYHPLRTVRLCTSHPTQSEFATFLGVSAATVQAVEQGKLKLTAQLAARIRELTGCSDLELLKGHAGKAKGLDGKSYTEAHFTQWQSKLTKSMEGNEAGGAMDTGDLEEMFHMILQAARRSSGASGVQAARTMVVESVEKIRQKLNLTDSLEEMLMPMQQCTVLTGSTAEWKKFPKGNRKERVGAVNITKGLKRLTLGWQACPSWSGGLPLKDRRATNVELFPPGYAVVSVGGAGCRIAVEFWLGAALQHGINPVNGRAERGGPGGNWPAFFRKVPQRESADRYVPRAVFLDLDSEVVEQIARDHPNFFHSGCFFVSHDGVNNSYAGPEHEEAVRLTQDALNFVAHHNADVGAPSGLILLHSLEGGTGSGLGGHVLRGFKQKWPNAPAFCLAPTPQRQVSHVVVAPYNALLGLHDIFTQADGALFLDSEAGDNPTVKQWGQESLDYADLNKLQAQILLMFLGPVRFPAEDAPPALLGEWLDSLNDGSPGPWLGVPRLLPLQKCAPRGQRAEIEVATAASGALSLQQNDIPASGHIIILQQGRKGDRPSKKELGPARASLRMRPRTELNPKDAVLCVADFSDLYQGLAFVAEQAGRLLKRKAYVQSFAATGVDLEKMQLALDILQAVLAQGLKEPGPEE